MEADEAKGICPLPCSIGSLLTMNCQTRTQTWTQRLQSHLTQETVTSKEDDGWFNQLNKVPVLGRSSSFDDYFLKNKSPSSIRVVTSEPKIHLHLQSRTSKQELEQDSDSYYDFDLVTPPEDRVSPILAHEEDQSDKMDKTEKPESGCVTSVTSPIMFSDNSSLAPNNSPSPPHKSIIQDTSKRRDLEVDLEVVRDLLEISKENSHRSDNEVNIFTNPFENNCFNNEYHSILDSQHLNYKNDRTRSLEKTLSKVVKTNINSSKQAAIPQFRSGSLSELSKLKNKINKLQKCADSYGQFAKNTQKNLLCNHVTRTTSCDSILLKEKQEIYFKERINPNLKYALNDNEKNLYNFVRSKVVPETHVIKGQHFNTYKTVKLNEETLENNIRNDVTQKVEKNWHLDESTGSSNFAKYDDKKMNNVKIDKNTSIISSKLLNSKNNWPENHYCTNFSVKEPVLDNISNLRIDTEFGTECQAKIITSSASGFTERQVPLESNKIEFKNKEYINDHWLQNCSNLNDANIVSDIPCPTGASEKNMPKRKYKSKVKKTIHQSQNQECEEKLPDNLLQINQSECGKNNPTDRNSFSESSDSVAANEYPSCSNNHDNGYSRNLFSNNFELGLEDIVNDKSIHSEIGHNSFTEKVKESIVYYKNDSQCRNYTDEEINEVSKEDVENYFYTNQNSSDVAFHISNKQSQDFNSITDDKIDNEYSIKINKNLNDNYSENYDGKSKLKCEKEHKEILPTFSCESNENILSRNFVRSRNEENQPYEINELSNMIIDKNIDSSKKIFLNNSDPSIIVAIEAPGELCLVQNGFNNVLPQDSDKNLNISSNNEKQSSAEINGKIENEPSVNLETPIDTADSETSPNSEEILVGKFKNICNYSENMKSSQDEDEMFENFDNAKEEFNDPHQLSGSDLVNELFKLQMKEPIIEMTNHDTYEEINQEENVQVPIKRSSSLRCGKTPPGTPGRKKIVRFADALGLDLADIRTYLDGVPNVPPSAFCDLQVEEDEMTSQHPSYASYSAAASAAAVALQNQARRYLMPMFQQPGALPDFIDRLREQKVVLENITVGSDLSVKGVVRVINEDFHKRVYVRYTFDHWKNYHEATATYVDGSCDGFSDRFSFLLWGSFLQSNGALVFCVKYCVKGREHWDNNQGCNYLLKCYSADPTAIPLPATDDDSEFKRVHQNSGNAMKPSHHHPIEYKSDHFEGTSHDPWSTKFF